MAVFKRIKDIYNTVSQNINPFGNIGAYAGQKVGATVNSQKKPTTKYSSNTQVEGQKKTLPTTNTIAPVQNMQSKPVDNPYSRVGNPYGINVKQMSTPQTPTAPATTPPPAKDTIQQTPTTDQVPADYRSRLENSYNQQMQNAGNRYSEVAPMIQEQYGNVANAYNQNIGNYQNLISQAQQREQAQKALIEQQYGTQAEQTAQTAGEADLRRAAEARRITQAQIDQKFANLGTLGSTGYFGQSGETQRSESDFLRGQQESMDKTRQAVLDIRNLKSQKLMEAKDLINKDIADYQNNINKINADLANNEVARTQALTKAFYDFQDTITAKEDQYNKDVQALDAAEMKYNSESSKDKLAKDATATINADVRYTIKQLLNQDTNLGAVSGIISSGNVPGLRTVVPGATVAAGLYNKLKGLTQLDNIKYLKGTGQISNAEQQILSNAGLRVTDGMPEADLRAILEETERNFTIEDMIKGGETPQDIIEVMVANGANANDVAMYLNTRPKD